jgi:hypothetical protein
MLWHCLLTLQQSAGGQQQSPSHPARLQHSSADSRPTCSCLTVAMKTREDQRLGLVRYLYFTLLRSQVGSQLQQRPAACHCCRWTSGSGLTVLQRARVSVAAAV